MKRTLRQAMLLCLTVLLSVAPCTAQLQGRGGQYTFGTVTATGRLGAGLNFIIEQASPSNYTVDWSYAGTAPLACTLQAEGSSDLVHWYSLTGPQDCTTATMIHVASKPVLYLRINVLTYTAGDNTTAVTVRYTRGS